MKFEDCQGTMSGYAGKSCPHCGQYHTAICPRIRALDFFADGTVKRVEYWPPPPIPSQVTAQWTVPGPAQES